MVNSQQTDDLDANTSRVSQAANPSQEERTTEGHEAVQATVPEEKRTQTSRSDDTSKLEAGITTKRSLFKWGDTDVFDGFPRMASFIAKDPAAAIYKRFDLASARNLLYLEGRVAALAREQRRLDEEDKKNKHREYYDFDFECAAGSWEDFVILWCSAEAAGIPEAVYHDWIKTNIERRANYEEIWRSKGGKSDIRASQLSILDLRERNPEQMRRIFNDLDLETVNTILKSQKNELIDKEARQRVKWKIALELKSALKEYHEALILQSEVFKLAHPAPRTKEAVISWFSGGEESGREKQFLSYTVMSTIFDDDKKVNDLVSLHSPPGDDRVSRALYWASPYLGGLLKNKSRSDEEISTVSEKKIAFWVTFFGLSAAITFLVAAVWALWAISYIVNKLAALTGFVILFALWVGILTKRF